MIKETSSNQLSIHFASNSFIEFSENEAIFLEEERSEQPNIPLDAFLYFPSRKFFFTQLLTKMLSKGKERKPKDWFSEVMSPIPTMKTKNWKV